MLNNNLQATRDHAQLSDFIKMLSRPQRHQTAAGLSKGIPMIASLSAMPETLEKRKAAFQHHLHIT